MNAIKSRSVSSWLGRVLKCTTLASIHITVRRRVGCHSAHCGCKSHSLGICARIVLRMSASFCVVHCHICGPSSHSLRRCFIVSCMPQFEPATLRFVAQRLNHCATTYYERTNANRIPNLIALHWTADLTFVKCINNQKCTSNLLCTFIRKMFTNMFRPVD